jgi:hypothetical protein
VAIRWASRRRRAIWLQVQINTKPAFVIRPFRWGKAGVEEDHRHIQVLLDNTLCGDLNTLNRNVRAADDCHFFITLIEAICLDAFSRLFVAGITVVADCQDVGRRSRRFVQ